MSTTTIVSLDMGYGHMRAAAPLASVLNTKVYAADRAPLADTAEEQRWKEAREFYERLTKFSQFAGIGRPLQLLVNGMTAIPHLHPVRDLSAPTMATKYLAKAIRNGLGAGMAKHLREHNSTLLTTFYAPAIAADFHGLDRVFCVVTDSDINRIWAPVDSSRTRITYLAPGPRVVRRLRSYGVPAERIEMTGFPLPDSLLGGPDLPALKKNLASRLVRLDPTGTFRSTYREELSHFLGPIPEASTLERRIPRVTFAVGGAGAQVEVGRQLIRALRDPILEGKLVLTLVAGIRAEVAEELHQAVAEAGLDGQLARTVDILLERNLEKYFARFNEVLADTDVLWTKPSELTFFGALGLPLVLAAPVGVHESFNRRWARECGAGLKQRDARYAWGWLEEWLQDGTLAGAAWSGFMRMPKFGTYRIAELVRRAEAK